MSSEGYDGSLVKDADSVTGDGRDASSRLAFGRVTRNCPDMTEKLYLVT